LDPSERPLDITAHSPDPKCRFFWKMSEAPPYETMFPALNAENVVPKDEKLRERWTPTMEKWGASMKQACVILCPTLAVWDLTCCRLLQSSRGSGDGFRWSWLACRNIP
jgi:hypothetical protein